MKDELTQQMLGLKQGDHLCLLYDEYPAELMAALVSYIQQGLEAGEQCIYIADDQTPEEVGAALEAGSIDVRAESGRKALRLWTRKEWRQPGELDPGQKAIQVRRLIDEALRSGFKGIRFAVEMTWTLEPDIDVEKLKRWEATLNRLFGPGVPGRIVCQYNCRRLSPSVVQAGLSTHPLAAFESQLFTNLFYEAPMVLEAKTQREKLNWMMGRLKQAKAAERAREEAIRKEATLAAMEVSKSKIEGILKNTITDIIERKRAEEEIGKLNSELVQRFLESAALLKDVSQESRKEIAELKRAEVSHPV